MSATAPNLYTIGTCIMSSCGALLFGLDVGITGGVIAMPPFLSKFFPDVYVQQQDAVVTNSYCSFDSQLLSLFTSCFFLAAMISSALASGLSAKFGRKASMFVGAVLYLVGSVLNVAAVHTSMLIIGRLLIGFGCGFINQSVPVFLAEIPPKEYRGALQTLFQVFVNLGILVAGLINYGTSRLEYGWRISLGTFIPPSLVLMIGCAFIPETPSSLFQNGKEEESLAILRKLRGGIAAESIDEEFQEIRRDAEEAKKNGDLIKQFKVLHSRPYRGELVVACLIAFFSQFTGINSMLYYTPELFKSLGSDSGLLNAVVVNAVLLAGALTSLVIIERSGRIRLLIAGGILMFLFQTVTSLLLRYKFDPYNPNLTDQSVLDGMLVLICLFTYSFGWSWGPLGWSLPVECQSQATRSAASGAAVIFNFLGAFLTTQFFLPLLCAMQWGTFLFFAGFDFVMVLFTWFFVVETKGVPVEEMHSLFQSHPFWKRYAVSTTIDDEDEDGHVEYKAT